MISKRQAKKLEELVTRVDETSKELAWQGERTSYLDAEKEEHKLSWSELTKFINGITEGE